LPRKDEPRIQVRLSHTDLETLKSLADAANLSLGALIRECAMRYSSAVVRDVRAGTIQLRRQHAVEATGGQVQPASALVVSSAALALERQRRLNAQRERASK
jgi:hypothetical protein